MVPLRKQPSDNGKYIALDEFGRIALRLIRIYAAPETHELPPVRGYTERVLVLGISLYSMYEIAPTKSNRRTDSLHLQHNVMKSRPNRPERERYHYRHAIFDDCLERAFAQTVPGIASIHMVLSSSMLEENSFTATENLTTLASAGSSSVGDKIAAGYATDGLAKFTGKPILHW